MKISIISFDLSHNCLGRAYILGKVLKRRYEVDIHGFLFPRPGDSIWKPCDTKEFDYRSLNGCNFPGFLRSVASMLRDISGDVIYASKLRMPSYGVALAKKFLSKRPVVLDIDDLEISWDINTRGLSRWISFTNPIGPLHTKWIEKLAYLADEVTTVSTQFQERYGRGVLVPHGKDTNFFNPERFDRERLRNDRNIHKFKIIMFLGTPQPHKGLEDIIKALNILDRDDVRFMMIGKGSNASYESLLKGLGEDKVIFAEQILFNEIPNFLCMADLVVLPQVRSLQTYGQIPGKLFDAMAMAKPIIATNVSDIPQILDNCGIIVEPGDIYELANRIEWVFSNAAEAHEMGRRARAKCVKEFSWDVMEDRLVGIFEKYR